MQVTKLLPKPNFAAELHTLSITYSFCGSAHTDTTDNLSEKCTEIYSHPVKMPVFLSIVHSLTGAAYSPRGFHKLS